MTFYERSESFPPVLCRLLARHKGGKPLTNAEIADGASCLNHFDIFTISRRASWDDVPMRIAYLFLRGCGLVFDNSKAWRRVDDYLRKKPNLEYLRKSPEWDSYYKPLLIRWRSSYPTIPDNVHKPVRDLLVRLTPILKATNHETK